ncbi:MAG: hypothetical protein Q7O66_00390 [Dehalococcoidia bacterium]|nr:hypothetical protein [Dehalococcoidia bacterium]
MSDMPIYVLPGLQEGLSNFHVPQLKWFCHALVGRPPQHKAEMVEFLVETLSDPVRVRRLWAKLSPLEQLVIAEVAYSSEGRYEPGQIHSKYDEAPSPNMSSDSVYGEKRPATTFDLFFCYFRSLGYFITLEVATIVHSLSPKPAPSPMASSDDPPGRTTSKGSDPMLVATELAIFHDLSATLNLIQVGRVSVGASQLPTLAAVRNLRALLQIGDYIEDLDYDKAEDAIRPLALLMLVQAADWARPTAMKGGRLALTKRGEALLGKPLEAHHIRDLWESWLANDIVDELSRVRNIKGQNSRYTHLTDPESRRDGPADALMACPIGRWVKIGEFFRFLRAEGLDPQIVRGDYSGLYLGYSLEYGMLELTGVGYWNIVIASYLRVLLMEYAATLGIVEMSHVNPREADRFLGDRHGVDDLESLSRYDGLLAIRLTNLGAFVLGLSEQYIQPARLTVRPFLKVLPNLDMVIVDAEAVTPNDRAFLGRVGIEKSKDVYRLSRDRLVEAAETGVGVGRVSEFLCLGSGLSESELPQTVSVFLTDTDRKLGALLDGGKALVLEADDAVLLLELARSASLRGMVRIANIDGKTVLLVPEEREAAARRHLKKLGYLPKRRS